jgi:hypothetical protein
MTLDHNAQLFIAEGRQLLDKSFESVEGDVCDLIQYIAVAAKLPCARLANAALDVIGDNKTRKCCSKSFFRSPQNHRGPLAGEDAGERTHGHEGISRTQLAVFERVAEQFKADVLAESQKMMQKRIVWDAIAEFAGRSDSGVGAWARSDIAAFLTGGRIERAVEARPPEPIAEGASGAAGELEWFLS